MEIIQTKTFEEKCCFRLNYLHQKILALAEKDRQYTLAPGAVCNWATQRDDFIIEFYKTKAKLSASGGNIQKYEAIEKKF